MWIKTFWLVGKCCPALITLKIVNVLISALGLTHGRHSKIYLITNIFKVQIRLSLYIKHRFPNSSKN